MSLLRHHQLLMGRRRTEGYRALMLSYGPTRYHPLDETSGSVMIDLSANAVNGTHGSVIYNQASPIGEGAAIGYNGSTSYSIMTSAPGKTLPPGLSDWSFVFLGRWTSSGLGVIAGVFSTIAPFYGPTVFVNYSGTAADVGRLVVRDSINPGYFALSPSTGLNDGQWRHWICQRRTVGGVGYIQIYKNGVLDTSHAMPSIANLASATLTVVGSRQGQQMVAGTFDEFAYFNNRSFSSAEAAAIFAASGL